MSIINSILDPVQIPRMVRVRQIFPDTTIKDVASEVKKQIDAKNLMSRIKPGQTVAITAGSRGITNLPVMIRELVSIMKSAGAHPFLVPAMGSHGGATAEGQVDMLAGMGITEEFCGAPIKASMEVVQVGTSDNGLPAYVDKNAYEADAIVIINRIKPHVAFKGDVESGLLKMITIGLGKLKGAETCHNLGFGRMAENIPAIAKVVLEKTNLVFGIAVLENAYEQTMKIVALANEDIAKEEPALLLEAKQNVPKIVFREFESLILDELGKNISGTGMDTRVIGKYHTPFADDGTGPKVTRLAVLDLTEQSHGNANGVGIADYTTRRLFEKIIFEQTYPNSLTSTVPESIKIPMVLENDRLAIQACIKCSNLTDRSKVRVVMIKNTIFLEHILISENMLEEARKNPQIEILSEPFELPFDEKGNLLYKHA